MGLALQVDQSTQEMVEIMPVNHISFDAFLCCQTQWRVAATMAGLIWQGLDYSAVRLVLDDIDAPRHVFADIRVMEAAALPVLNERDD
ncbi:DUF1799 domain-containing protein [Brucella anthropi]|uniref:DUF1799 domain-containing protein n=1 Tax=Brucella anthropi TaxID=529 RepID=UPI0005BA94F8|nr:DUF1799 domain-containing protein [Brucella anthropi]